MTAAAAYVSQFWFCCFQLIIDKVGKDKGPHYFQTENSSTHAHSSSSINMSSNSSCCARPGCVTAPPNGSPAAPLRPTTDFSSWKLSGPYNSCKEITIETVQSVGAGGKAYYFTILWERYAAGGRFDPEITKAFIKGALNLSRCCCDVITPIIPALCQFEHLAHDDFTELSFLCADASCDEGARILLRRSKGVARPVAFYLNMMRLATENIRVVDMDFALEACADMEAQGIAHSSPSLRFLIHGFSRLQNVPFAAVLKVMDYRLSVSEDVEACMMHEFLQVVERASGPDAQMCVEYLQKMKPSNIHAVVADVVNEKPECPNKGCHKDNCMVGYYLVDPFSANIEEIRDIPENSYVFFLFSSVRSMIMKAKGCGLNHPLAQKIQQVKALIDRFPKQCHIFPVEYEIGIRSKEMHIDGTPHSKMLAFCEAILPSANGLCKFNLVARDAKLMAAVGASDVTVVSSVP